MSPPDRDEDISVSEVYRGIQRLEATVARLVTSDRYLADQRVADERALVQNAKIGSLETAIEELEKDRLRTARQALWALVTALVAPLIVALVIVLLSSGHG